MILYFPIFFFISFSHKFIFFFLSGVIVWDLNQNNFGFLRRLREGKGGKGGGRGKERAIVGVSMNHLEGDIAACSGGEVWTWSINGHPYVRKNLKKEGSGGGVGGGGGSVKGKGGSFSPITALLMSNQEAWTGHNFCITGHEDGQIKVIFFCFFVCFFCVLFYLFHSKILIFFFFSRSGKQSGSPTKAPTTAPSATLFLYYNSIFMSLL